MQRKSSLTFPGLERRATLLPRRVVWGTGLLRIAACIAAFVIAGLPEVRPDPGWPLSLGLFTGYTLLSCAARFWDRGAKRVRYLLFFEILYVQIMGYHDHSLVFMEFLFIPLALIDIGLMFPLRGAIALESICGLFAAPLMSYCLQARATVPLGGASLPLSAMTWPLYAACACFGCLLALLVRHQRQMLAAYHAEREISRNLDSINRILSSRMFAIKSESEQSAKMQVTKDVHDNVGYIFTNLTMMLQATEAVYEREPQRAGAMLGRCVEYGCSGINEIRNTLRAIRDAEQPKVHIRRDLNELIRLFSRCTGTHVTLEYGNWPAGFTPQIDAFLLSFVKETLTNALKHGMADTIQITCRVSKDELSMTVKDNGTGHTGPLQFGIGLQSIQSVALQFGGSVKASPHEDGFAVRVRLPYGKGEKGLMHSA